FAPAELFGAGPQSAAWLWAAWHVGAPALLCLYVAVDRRPRMRRVLPTRLAVWGSIGVAALVIGIMAVATLRHDHLPVIIPAGDYRRLTESGIGPAVLAANVVALAAILISTRCRTVMQLWLAVSTFASLLGVALTLAGQARFTLGWYGARAFGVVA